MKVEIKRYRSGKQRGTIRKNVVEIDNYDVWNCDFTLAQILNPLLIKFKETTKSYGKVGKEDVPGELHSTYDTCGYSQEAFHWMLGEMIFAMQEIANNNENEPDVFVWPEENEHLTVLEQARLVEKIPGGEEAFKAYHDRVQNGCRLFGLHFQNLWS